MDSNLVLILGSKPNANIPKKVSHVFAANASAYFYNDLIPPNAKVCVVISASELYDDNLNKREKWEKIFSRDNDNFIVMATDKVPGCEGKLYEQCCNRKIESFTSNERRKIFNILLGHFWFLPPNIPFKLFFNLVSDSFFYRLIKAKIKSIYLKKDLPAEFRPSTGMLALALAISRNPSNIPFVIAGIGFNRKEQYPDGSNPTILKRVSHLIPDKCALFILKRKYKLFTTDLELSKDFGLALLL
jgi:hypothetical protein